MFVPRMCGAGCASCSAEDSYYYLARRSYVRNKSFIPYMYVSIYCELFVTKLTSVQGFGIFVDWKVFGLV
ncbi:hypothetical protein ACE6H2_011281 [Prunus campanulata]